MCGTKATVKDATVFDLLIVGTMAESYATEVTQMKNHKVNHEKLMRSLAYACVDPEQYLRILSVNGKIAGAMWGAVSTMPWSDTPITQDFISYVLPQFRGYGIVLLRDWVKWSISKGAKECSLSTGSGIDTERTCKLFEKQGFDLVGYSFIKEL